jgi:hypothetical protein
MKNDCPFCSGHGCLSPAAVKAIAAMIYFTVDATRTDSVSTELLNIRSQILNSEEREPVIDDLLS